MTTEQIIEAEILGLWHSNQQGYMNLHQDAFDISTSNADYEKAASDSLCKVVISTEEYFFNIKKEAFQKAMKENYLINIGSNGKK